MATRSARQKTKTDRRRALSLFILALGHLLCKIIISNIIVVVVLVVVVFLVAVVVVVVSGR